MLSSDLILIGEFSELEGPVPLLTIPKNLIPLNIPQKIIDKNLSQSDQLCEQCNNSLNAKKDNPLKTAEVVTESKPSTSTNSNQSCVIDCSLSEFPSPYRNCSCLISNTNRDNSQMLPEGTSCDTNYSSPNNPDDFFNLKEVEKVQSDRNMKNNYFCDITLEKKSLHSFISCNVHGKVSGHKCSCEKNNAEIDSVKLNLLTHQQRATYNDINLNDLILKLMSTDYQNYT